jgi:hypothetical protein
MMGILWTSTQILKGVQFQDSLSFLCFGDRQPVAIRQPKILFYRLVTYVFLCRNSSSSPETLLKPFAGNNDHIASVLSVEKIQSN